MQIAATPVPYFTDGSGNALEGGFIYIGAANQNPETTPISVFWDSALTQPATQPIRTIGGIPTRNGSPANVYAASSFSITVRNKNGALVYSFPESALTNAGISLATALTDSASLSSGDALVAFKQTFAGATASTVHEKLSRYIDVKDAGAVGDGVADDTTAVQTVIDGLPASGGEVYFPPGTYDLTGLRIDGTAGNKVNVTLRGAGSATELRISAGNANNVIKALNGSGFRILNMRIRGAKGRGVTGVNAPSKGFWTPTTVYALNDTVEVSSGDAQTTTVAAGNLVYKCTSAHTSSAAFSTDKATKWTLVTDANFNTSDQSYATRNCIYLDGVTNASVEGCDLLDAVYAGVNVGTGPVQPANAGAGSAYVRIENNHIENCTSAAAGGKQTYCTYVGNTVKSCTAYGIVIDDPLSYGNTITGNNVVGCGSHGIYLYGCDMSSVVGNTVSYCYGVGILIDSGAVDNPIVGNVVSNCLQGIRAYNSSVAAMIGNFCRANTQYGIAVDTMSQVALTGNVCDNNLYDGIRLTSVSAFSLSGNSCFANQGEGGVYLTGCSNGSISGGCMLNNNNSGSPLADGAGVRLVNSTTVSVVGVTAYDSRAGASKTQKYGVRSTGTSDAVKLAGNTLAGNATSDFSLSGTANRVAGDTATATLASIPANFSATHMLTFIQPDGSIAYVPARLGGW